MKGRMGLPTWVLMPRQCLWQSMQRWRVAGLGAAMLVSAEGPEASRLGGSPRTAQREGWLLPQDPVAGLMLACLQVTSK